MYQVEAEHTLAHDTEIEDVENEVAVTDKEEGKNLLTDDEDKEPPNTIEQEMDNKYEVQTGTYQLRPRKPRDYIHLHATLENIVMTQHNMKKRIELFGDAGVEAVLKELQQRLHDRKVRQPWNQTELSTQEKKQRCSIGCS